MSQDRRARAIGERRRSKLYDLIGGTRLKLFLLLQHSVPRRMMAFRGISKRFHLILSLSNPSYAASQFFFSRGFSSKLFVKGISFSTTEKSLAEAFSKFGHIVESKIIRDKASNRSKGFGYVTFATEDEARKALMEMNGKLVDGRPVFVDNA